MLCAKLAYMCNVAIPILDVANALNANVVQMPLMTKRNTASSHRVLYGVAISNSETIGLYLLSKSWRVNSQSSVAVVKCWIWMEKRNKKKVISETDNCVIFDWPRVLPTKYSNPSISECTSNWIQRHEHRPKASDLSTKSLPLLPNPDQR